MVPEPILQSWTQLRQRSVITTSGLIAEIKRSTRGDNATAIMEQEMDSLVEVEEEVDSEKELPTVICLSKAPNFSPKMQALFSFFSMLKNHTKKEIVGFNYKNNGRICNNHSNGCGLPIQVDDIVECKKTEAFCKEEHVSITKRQEIASMTKDALRKLLVNEYGVLTGLSTLKKEQLVNKILELEGNGHDPEPLTKTIEWTEEAVDVYSIRTKCKVGYISRSFVNLYSAVALDGLHARIIRLRGQSTFKAERN